jgi:SAM-dependent methyltransferase
MPAPTVPPLPTQSLPHSATLTPSASIWRCPRCRGALVSEIEGLRCDPCSAVYPTFEGIPDLRLPGASWIDHEADRAEAKRIAHETAGMTAIQTARYVYGTHAECTSAWADKRARQVAEARPRLARELQDWLDSATRGPGPFLDLGCGAGQLLAAAAAENRHGIGIDVRLVWLLVAKRLIEEAGGKPVLAAAMAESLPLANDSLQGVVSLDVIEHVGDVERYLQEINRVTAPGGFAAFATPNRYSLTAEPHVYIWGVGWLPRRWQKAYVKFRKNVSYDFTRLLSVSETRRLLKRHTRLRPRFIVPPVAEQEIVTFPPARRAAARLYNRLAGSNVLSPLFRAIGPFFRVVAEKQPSETKASGNPPLS